MDSWSRPTKSQPAPPPLYLTQGEDARYCHTCGRIIGSRRVNSSKANASEVKYCSDKCKHHRPNHLDGSIENALLALLLNRDADGGNAADNAKSRWSKSGQKIKKGDPRIIVKMSDIETAVFGHMHNPEKVYGRNKNRAKRGLPDPEEWRSVDMEERPPQEISNASITEYEASNDQDQPDTNANIINLPSNHVRPSQLHSDVNGSVGGEKGWAEKIDETPEMLQKRLEGQRKAENRETVRNVARRAVAFGLSVDSPLERSRSSAEQPDKVRRKCEALMNGNVVDPSFAKGDWSIRWRDD